MRTIVVTGGRTYSDAARVAEVLQTLWHRAGSMVVRHGDATGADRLAKDWCLANGVPDDPFAITMQEWRTYGKAAGPVRNERMLCESPTPDLLVAFPGGKGTADCVLRAQALRIPVLVVPPRTDTSPA